MPFDGTKTPCYLSISTLSILKYLLCRKGVEQAKYRLAERMKDVNFWREELKQEIQALRYKDWNSDCVISQIDPLRQVF